MFSVTHEIVTVPTGRDRKIWLTLRTNQILRFVTVPTKKKINMLMSYAYTI